MVAMDEERLNWPCTLNPIMSGNLSHSMRDNYETHGVENVTFFYLRTRYPTDYATKYYTIVSSSYRNPHYEGVKHVLFDWMNT